MTTKCACHSQHTHAKAQQATRYYASTNLQFAWNEELKDWYAPYNKPGAVIDYFEHHDPKEGYVVILDPDMLLRKPFNPRDLPLERGWAYAADYNYLVGTENAMAVRHVPEVPPRYHTQVHVQLYSKMLL